MIAYRAEVWCDGCREHYGKGIAHDDHTCLPILARNLEKIALRDSWVKAGAAHYCVKCQRQRGSTDAPPARGGKA